MENNTFRKNYNYYIRINYIKDENIIKKSLKKNKR